MGKVGPSPIHGSDPWTVTGRGWSTRLDTSLHFRHLTKIVPRPSHEGKRSPIGPDPLGTPLRRYEFGVPSLYPVPPTRLRPSRLPRPLRREGRWGRGEAKGMGISSSPLPETSYGLRTGRQTNKDLHVSMPDTRRSVDSHSQPHSCTPCPHSPPPPSPLPRTWSRNRDPVPVSGTGGRGV